MRARLAPVEQSRRRQLEFTADASHELRHPAERDQGGGPTWPCPPRGRPRSTRDFTAPDPGREPAAAPAGRGHAVAGQVRLQPPRRPAASRSTWPRSPRPAPTGFRAVGPAVSAETPDGAVADQRAAGVDRPAGRGAGRQTPAGTRARTAWSGSRSRAQGSRASLTVEDSGPGILEAERPLLFRPASHRATEHGSGAGLGLAIGDSIVRSTGGRWHVGDSPLGGALMSVSWRHAQPGPYRGVLGRPRTSGVGCALVSILTGGNDMADFRAGDHDRVRHRRGPRSTHRPRLCTTAGRRRRGHGQAAAADGQPPRPDRRRHRHR